MTPDHEAAKKIAVTLVDEKCAGVVDIAYLDAMARLDKAEKERDAYKKAKRENDERFILERDEARARLARATELLEEYASVKRAGVGTGLLAKTRLFLAAERK